MADTRPGFGVLLVIGALLACATPTPERLLDQTCREGRCKTIGSARETSGLTADSIGYELGPGPGSVTITVPGQKASSSAYLEVLVKGSGSLVVSAGAAGCTSCSQSIELHDGWRWEHVSVSGTFLGAQTLTVVVETLDDTSRVALLDLRVNWFLSK